MKAPACPRGPAWLHALAGGALLAMATPPAVFAGAEFLVLGGLAVWFAIATAGRRPCLHSYLLGCVHMAWFSWSVRHVMLPAYGAIVVLGGFYFVLGSMMVRRLPGRAAPFGFAIAVAASFWLRANMPDIYYPHGQPCHCLWQWPVLLGGLVVGGEPLVNGLLALLAASAVGLWRSWRVGLPQWRKAARTAALASAFAIAVTAVGAAGIVAAGGLQGVGAVSIVAIEPGLHSFDPYAGLSDTEARQRFRELFEDRLHEPTRRVLAAEPAPDLVLWPESSLPLVELVDEIDAGTARVSMPTLPAGRLLLGANTERERGGRPTPSAFLVELPAGRILGRNDKRRLVPGGEFLPLVGWLPDAVTAAIRDAFTAALGSVPDCVPGEFLPPLQTARGVPFGALLCYDNAFPGPAADLVAAGAQFLCVLSNESWYRGGGELTQLVAMSACRAIELATPVVRCTTDGWSVAIGADGRLVADLPLQPSPSPASRILRVDLPLGPGHQPPMAWLQASTGPGAAILLGLVLLHGLWGWARLRVARTAPSEGWQHP